jgi:peptidoglycan-N-acetylglucosamine deacetylase
LTRRLSGTTRRLTLSENANLTWRIIAGGTKPGEAHGLLRAWPGWEQIERILWPVYTIPGAPYGLLCFRIMPYRGEPMVLPDTTTVAPGAILGELHCNNRAIFELVSRGSNPFAACREDLKSLSNWIVQDRLGRQIEALYGCTILTMAAYRLGFTVLEKPITLRRRLEKVFFKGLLLLYNHEGLERIQHGNTADIYPADVWLSRRELLRLYHDRNEPERRPHSQSAAEHN